MGIQSFMRLSAFLREALFTMLSLYITAKVAGKPVSILEASIRSDLLFNDADGIDSLPNQAIFDAIQLMGPDEGTVDQTEGRSATPTTLTTTPTIFGDDETIAQVLLNMNFDDIKARIEADRLLALRLQEEEREQFTLEERAKFLHDTIAAQRRFLAEQRAAAIRNRPPTRTQLRSQMMTYLKHVGNKKHSDLKNKTFEEIQGLYEKVKRFDESFTVIGSTEDERNIKEMNEGASNPEKKKKIVKEDVLTKVPVKPDVAEQGTKKRKGGHMKMLARKRKRPQPDVDSNDEHRKCLNIVTFEGTIDSEIIERKYVIARLNKVSSPDGDYLVIYRANGNFKAFNYLMEVLHIFDRQDLFHLYDLVMKQYSEVTLEGIELILWGDLKIMMESSTEENDQSDFWNNQQNWEIIRWRLYEACGVYILELEDGTFIHMSVERMYPLSKDLLVLNSPCFMVKSWLVQDQIVLGKDYSNLLIADSLLKTIWFINAPCYGNEALASPKSNELTIPEQTATSKGKSNPFMACSLPKNYKANLVGLLLKRCCCVAEKMCYVAGKMLLLKTYYPIWEVIQRGNGPVSVSTDTNGLIKVLPPKTAEETLARERERKARTTLLMALPEDHLGKFHKMTDAKETWEAIKYIFGGVSTKDANQKFLRSLPSAWSQVSLIMMTKPGVDSLRFDDLYNNLRVFESDVKGSTASSSSTQNVAFVSENTSSTNDVSTAYSVSNSSAHNSQHEHTSSYSLLANQSSCPQLDHEDLDQLDEFDLEEMDLKWQVAMISMRMKKFYKKTGRKLQFDAKEPVGSIGNQDGRRRDAWNTGNKEKDNGRRSGKQEDSKALVTIDGEGVDWTSHSKDEQENYAFMACNSSGSDTAMSVTKAEYIAASEAAMEAVWIRTVLHFANEPGVQKGAKHYHKRYHYVHESIALGEIRFLKVHTDDNLAGPFMKALSKEQLTQHARSMRLHLASSFM
ncbi:hypothetical protein Tco_0582676 [Tanacetum coccineum]